MYFASTRSPPRLGSFCGHKKQGYEAEHLLPPYRTKIKNKQKYAYGELEFCFLTDFSLSNVIHKLISIINLRCLLFPVTWFYRLQIRILLFPFQKLNSETVYKNTRCFFYREKHKEATECVQRAKQIFELHYGIWNTGLQDILYKEQQLEKMVL